MFIDYLKEKRFKTNVFVGKLSPKTAKSGWLSHDKLIYKRGGGSYLRVTCIIDNQANFKVLNYILVIISDSLCLVMLSLYTWNTRILCLLGLFRDSYILNIIFPEHLVFFWQKNIIKFFLLLYNCTYFFKSFV